LARPGWGVGRRGRSHSSPSWEARKSLVFRIQGRGVPNGGRTSQVRRLPPTT